MRRKKVGQGKALSGTVVGIFVFLLGIGLLIYTFSLAKELFAQPPSVALGIEGSKTLDLNKTSESASHIVVRVIMLVIMGLLGSVIASRGIKMYAESLPHSAVEPDDETEFEKGVTS